MAAYNNALIHNKTTLVVAMMREDEKYGVCTNEYKNVSHNIAMVLLRER